MFTKKHPKVFAVRSILACAKKSQLAAMLLAIVTGCATKSEFQPRNPIAPGFADPTVIRDENGTWWAYGTNGGGYAVPMLYSENLAEWRFAGSALKTMPDWHPNRFRAGLWAPHIARIGKVYVLYYSLAVWKPKQSLLPHPSHPSQGSHPTLGSQGPHKAIATTAQSNRYYRTKQSLLPHEAIATTARSNRYYRTKQSLLPHEAIATTAQSNRYYRTKQSLLPHGAIATTAQSNRYYRTKQAAIHTRLPPITCARTPRTQRLGRRGCTTTHTVLDLCHYNIRRYKPLCL